MQYSIDGLQFEIGIARTDEDRAGIFALRLQVFVEEQHVPPEEELDAYDVLATHFLARVRNGTGTHRSAIVGTARFVDKGARVGKIGRVAVHVDYRGMGVGAAIMRTVHEFARAEGFHRLDLEAQCYAIPFYEKLGYMAHGDVFLDANIEHRHMSMTLSAEQEPNFTAPGLYSTPSMSAQE